MLPRGVDFVHVCVQEVPDGVLRRREEVGGNATDSEVRTEMQAEVAGCDVAVESSLEGGNVGRGDGGVNLGLRGEGVGDEGVQVAGQTCRVVIEGGGWERAARESDANVNGREGGLVIGEGTGRDAATAGAVRNSEVGAQHDGASVVDQAVARH